MQSTINKATNKQSAKWNLSKNKNRCCRKRANYDSTLTAKEQLK